jgi:hypothetical protein
MPEIARHSHYVPEAYLRGWSDAGGNTAHAYRLLVPHADYPIWERRPIRSLLAFTDLYTSVGPDGGESDVFERWVNYHIETPAAEPLEKVRADGRLTREEWRALAMYVAALDLRTPARYVELMVQWGQMVPDILRRTLTSTLRDLEEKAAAGERIEATPSPSPDIPFPLRVTTKRNAEGQGGWLRAEITMGRQMWVHDMQRMLANGAKRLREHRWSILRPAAGLEWVTSDVPVLRLNYYGPGKYDFKGGWDRKNGEILVPLSPRHLLYTRMGSRWRSDETLSRDTTMQFMELLAQRAERSIVARQPSAEAERLKPRAVNLRAYLDEEKAQCQWHDMQTRAAGAAADELIVVDSPVRTA